MIEKIADALEVPSPQLFEDKSGQPVSALEAEELKGLLLKNIEAAINKSLQIT